MFGRHRRAVADKQAPNGALPGLTQGTLNKCPRSPGRPGRCEGAG
ncbi:hypothetical protein BN2537_16625 [Streptomyces venezuelae]|nr:hypothetical protein BN2537_16625 [Streptomyces venezuelae]